MTNISAKAGHMAATSKTPSRVRVGKDILELVSTAMYVEPLTIYREYIQNAADAVDLARDAGLLGEDEHGKVEIHFDPSPKVRSVRIRDNGVGQPRPTFTETLTALGGSAKRGARARGFRGVGRLSGLGYAREVIFRSRAAGEADVAEMIWDCQVMRTVLRDPKPQSIDDIIPLIARVETISGEGYPGHFFEVELRGVVRQGADRLMSPNAVHDYLAQVAPVPFAPEFSGGPKIVAALAEHTRMVPLDIEIEGLGQVFRPHRDTLVLSDGRTVQFDEVEIKALDANDEGIGALIWVLHHEYEGALPPTSLVKGLRVRAGDVQVGEQSLFEDKFSEPRFNAWSVGEVHVLDPKLLPNGRRDNFESNVHLTNLINQVAPFALEISARCRTSSTRRKWLRDFNMHEKVAVEKLGILEQRVLTGSAHTALAEEAAEAVRKLEKISAVKTINDADRATLSQAAAAVREKLAAAGAPAATSPLDRLPQAERAQLERFFELVYECSINRVAAKALVDRIVERVVEIAASEARGA